jgi:hypothetical protein
LDSSSMLVIKCNNDILEQLFTLFTSISRTTFKIRSKLFLSSPNNYKSCKYVSCIALFFMKWNLTTWNGFKLVSNLNVKSCEFLHVAYTWIKQMSAWKSIGWVHKQGKQMQQNWWSRPNINILQIPTQAHHMIKKGVIPMNMKRYLQ